MRADEYPRRVHHSGGTRVTTLEITLDITLDMTWVTTQVNDPSPVSLRFYLTGWQSAISDHPHDGTVTLAQHWNGLIHGHLRNFVPAMI